MEKEIKLVMNEDKNIQILVNDVSKYMIKESERKISAKTIYDLLDYKIGDRFIILMENEKKVDTPVLKYFEELFKDICDKINEINIDEDDIILENVN